MFLVPFRCFVLCSFSHFRAYTQISLGLGALSDLLVPCLLINLFTISSFLDEETICLSEKETNSELAHSFFLRIGLASVVEMGDCFSS